MTVDHKENKSSDDYRITILDTIGPMIAELLKESKKNRQEMSEIKSILKRLTN